MYNRYSVPLVAIARCFTWYNDTVRNAYMLCRDFHGFYKRWRELKKIRADSRKKSRREVGSLERLNRKKRRKTIMTPPARCMHLRLENATWHPLLILSRNKSWLMYMCIHVSLCMCTRLLLKLLSPFFPRSLCNSHSSLHRLQHAIKRRQIEKIRALVL